MGIKYKRTVLWVTLFPSRGMKSQIVRYCNLYGESAKSDCVLIVEPITTLQMTLNYNAYFWMVCNQVSSTKLIFRNCTFCFCCTFTFSLTTGLADAIMFLPNSHRTLLGYWFPAYSVEYV